MGLHVRICWNINIHVPTDDTVYHFGKYMYAQYQETTVISLLLKSTKIFNGSHCKDVAASATKFMYMNMCTSIPACKRCRETMVSTVDALNLRHKINNYFCE